jgi:hypothetical protein
LALEGELTGEQLEEFGMTKGKKRDRRGSKKRGGQSSY